MTLVSPGIVRRQMTLVSKSGRYQSQPRKLSDDSMVIESKVKRLDDGEAFLRMI